MNQSSDTNILLQVEPLLLSLFMMENIIRKGPLLIIIPQVFCLKW